jgi:hypothetical protein
VLIEYPYARNYMFTALEAGPPAIEGLIAELTPEVADYRPDPDRFTIREVVAHLADWEPIWLLRMRAVCEQDEPTMPGYDVGQMAVDHDYAHSDPVEQLARYHAGRAAISAYLKERSETDWSRCLIRPEIGRLSLEALTLLVPLHDAYHAKQIVDWSKGYGG